MLVTASEQMLKATDSKMLVGNMVSPRAERTTTKATTKAATAATLTTVNPVPTLMTKLSNQDNHNERVAAGVDEKHLWHAMLGNFNQQNEQQQHKLENSNINNNNNDINFNISYGEGDKQSKQDNSLRLNALSENNTSCCGGDNYIKQYYERRLNDNGIFSESHLRVQPTFHTPTIATVSCMETATPSTSALSISACEPLLSQMVSEPTTVAAKIATFAILHEETPTKLEILRPHPRVAAAFNGVSGLKNPNSTRSTKDTKNAEAGGRGKGVPSITNKISNTGSTRKRSTKKSQRYCSFKSSSTQAEIKTSKICETTENSTIKTITRVPSLNFGALTSIALNSTLLALCNATTMTAVSAMAATFGESISGVLKSDVHPAANSTSSTTDFWGSTTQNLSATTLANGGNSSIHGPFNGLHVASNSGTIDIFSNDSDILMEDRYGEYIFDRTDVRIVFITLYTVVFCFCFFGNLIVILVVTLSRRLRSITNFFLANLALADFCVGLFCVLQNLTIYLIDSWVFGEFLCRMYQFVHSLSYTASIFILVVICMERYFAIVHPITCKQILTAARLRIVILTVWVASAIYSTPKFIFSKTIKNVHENGHEEEICVLDRKMFDSRVLDMISFGLLYVVPLLVMLILYTKIAIALWRSSHGLSHHLVVTQQNKHQQLHQHHQQQQEQHQQHPQQEQQQDESLSLHNSMYHHQHHHAHSHAHNHCVHNNHQTQFTTTTTTTPTTTNNINHQELQQQLSNATLTTTPIVGVVGMNAVGGIDSSVGVVCGSSNITSGGLLSHKPSIKYEKRAVSITESQVSLDSERPIVSACRNGGSSSNNNNNGNNSGINGGSMNSSHKSNFMQHHHHSSTHSHPPPHSHQRPRVNHMSHSSNNVLRARRGVVRMLIIFVLTFAICNLPYHARKMWQYWSRSYQGDSNFYALFTPVTFLVTYFNSAINPLLYAFLSRNFRKGMKELLACKDKTSSNSSMHHKRVAVQTHSLPTDTTHIGNEQL